MSWWWRALAAVALFAGVVAIAWAQNDDPEPLRVALLATVGVLAVGVLLDSLPERSDPWGRDSVPTSRTARGRDRTTTAHLRALEHHLSARQPGIQLRDRLVRLADEALMTRHGVSRHDPEGRALLGADVADVLDGPPQRLSVRTISTCIERIDQL